MRVREIMTEDPDYCRPGDSVQRAAIIMKDADAGAVPVIGDVSGKVLTGIVTDRDLCLATIAAGRDPKRVRIEECMTAQVVACHPEDDAARALALMAENQVRRLPVTDRDGALVGIISLSDLSRRGVSNTADAGEALREISEQTGEASRPRAESAVVSNQKPRSSR